MDWDSLEYILNVSRQMAETRDLDRLLNYVMDKAIRLAGAERGYVVLMQQDRVPDDALDFRVQRGQDGQALEDAQDQISHSILRQVVESGEPLVLRDAAQDPRFGAADSVVILGLRSVMCVPLITQGETIGAIYVENRSIRGRFSQDDVAPLILFANQAAVAIENARLFQALQQSHDELEMRVEERTFELLQANAQLEQEVAERKQMEEAIHQLYEQTRRDAEAKTTLLREVNHRVRNNLTSIIGLIQTEQRYASAEGRDAVGTAMERLVQRINGLAEVHDMLSQSAWSPLLLSDLAEHIMSAALNALPLDQLVFVDVSPSQVKVSPRQASNLALILNELVTNTVKHATSDHAVIHVAVHIGAEGNDTVLLAYRDDGPGYPEGVLHLERHGMGLYLIQNLVRHALGGSLALANAGGAVTTIQFEAEEGSTT